MKANKKKTSKRRLADKPAKTDLVGYERQGSAFPASERPDTQLQTAQFGAAKAAKASAAKAVAAQAKADKAAARKAAKAAKDAAAKAAPKRAGIQDGIAVTVTATPFAPGYLAGLGTPQIQLGGKVNAVAIQPTGVPQTVYVAELVKGVWRHRAKCGVPANAPGVVKIPFGTLAFSKRGGGDIELVTRAV